MVLQSGWKLKTKEQIKEIYRFSENYKEFLDLGKTEREAARYIVSYLENQGFTGDSAGTRVFRANRAKQVIAFVKGEKPIRSGLNIVVAHIDAPRLDFKENPLYEDVDLAMFRTHYYGGIKKYQWVSIPLSVHGVVIKSDGTAIDVVIGEDDRDPVFVIDDLLPHLSRRTQEEKKLANAIEGEKLVLLAGSIPLVGETTEPVKQGILKILKEQYGISEEDFVSAEFEVVPAFKARDVGLDRSMVGAYGQDDRICGYTLLRAIAETQTPATSCLAIFVDKEEIGSEGNTGMKSSFLSVFLYDILEGMGLPADEATVKRALFQSRALSADVNAAVNPTYQEVHERQNASYLGRGICISKYTGHGGKGGANDAHAEFVGSIRKIFNDNKILWHAAGMGKVDEGGGGTVAKYLAEYGMDIVDCGPSLLTMHSPYEISSKLDVYETYQAYKAFFHSR